MSKNALHSLLAVETDLKNVSNKIKNETGTTFIKKDDHFEGLLKVYVAIEEGNNFSDKEEKKEIVTTVVEKLEYAKKAIANGLNATLSKEETNASGTATAELKVGEINFGMLSATSLLALEKELVAIRKVYGVIPTLDPAKPWKRDEMEEGMKWITEPSTTYRTSKVEDFRVVYEATKEHPAQIQKVVKDKTVGKYLTTYKSGKITPLAKSKLLDKIDNLILAVKRARSKANQAEVIKSTVGTQLMDYINSDLV